MSPSVSFSVLLLVEVGCADSQGWDKDGDHRLPLQPNTMIVWHTAGEYGWDSENKKLASFCCQQTFTWQIHVCIWFKLDKGN